VPEAFKLELANDAKFTHVSRVKPPVALKAVHNAAEGVEL
jgi:hypothetical protein